MIFGLTGSGGSDKMTQVVHAMLAESTTMQVTLPKRPKYVHLLFQSDSTATMKSYGCVLSYEWYIDADTHTEVSQGVKVSSAGISNATGITFAYDDNTGVLVITGDSSQRFKGVSDGSFRYIITYA